MENKIPNLFIVGFAKSGTTALAKYLGEHKQIFISSPKEPHFFANDLPKYRKTNNIKHYLDMFNTEASLDASYRGEASVYYIYSECAIKNIFDFNKESKIIVMIRNPIDMLYSLHSQLLFSRNENISNFIEAWNAQDSRKNGFNIPHSCTDEKILQYKEVGFLGKQIARIFECGFKREQIHFILFEDFVANTRQVYKETLNFLDIKDDNRTQFPIVNPNTIHRIKILSLLYINTPQWLTKTVYFFKKIFGLKEINLSSKIYNLNTKTKRRNPLNNDFRKQLLVHFKSDIKLLESLINKDLKKWLE